MNAVKRYKTDQQYRGALGELPSDSFSPIHNTNNNTNHNNNSTPLGHWKNSTIIDQVDLQISRGDSPRPHQPSVHHQRNNNLSIPILFHVFAFLDARDLFLQVERVCKAWR